MNALQPLNMISGDWQGCLAGAGGGGGGQQVLQNYIDIHAM